MKEKKTKISVRNITLMAMLIAIEIVLSRFCSIQAWNVKIGFAFIAPVTAAILMGPAQAAVVAGVADVLGTLMFPIGPYFPGFTLNSCLNGLVWGLFLHKKPSIPKAAMAAGINQFVIGLFITTFWISMLYGSPYVSLLPVRLTQACILFIAQFITISVLQEVLFKRLKVVFQTSAVNNQ